MAIVSFEYCLPGIFKGRTGLMWLGKECPVPQFLNDKYTTPLPYHPYPLSPTLCYPALMTTCPQHLFPQLLLTRFSFILEGLKFRHPKTTLNFFCPCLPSTRITAHATMLVLWGAGDQPRALWVLHKHGINLPKAPPHRQTFFK